jgi:hypothetical protein
MLLILALALAAPAAARDQVPREVDQAARRLLKEAARSDWYRAFRREHRKQKPLVGVYLRMHSTDGRMGSVEGPDGPATAIVRKQGAFAVLAVNGKKPADAYGKKESAPEAAPEAAAPGKRAKKQAPRWKPVANLRFEADLLTRTIRLDLLGPTWRSKPEWTATIEY